MHIDVAHGVTGTQKLFDGGAAGLARSAGDGNGLHLLIP
jgi:hypothetical protein